MLTIGAGRADETVCMRYVSIYNVNHCQFITAGAARGSIRGEHTRTCGLGVNGDGPGPGGLEEVAEVPR